METIFLLKIHLSNPLKAFGACRGSEAPVRLTLLPGKERDQRHNPPPTKKAALEGIEVGDGGELQTHSEARSHAGGVSQRAM
jgi:hypothetical protein